MNPQILCSLQIGAVFKQSEHPCVGATFSRDGSNLGVGFEDGTVMVIDSNSGKVTKTHRSHKYGLSKFTYLNNDPTGSLAIAAACPSIIADYTLRVWDLVQNRFCRIFRGHDTPILTLSPHSNKDVTVSTSLDGLTCVWDTREERPVWQHYGELNSVSTFDRADDSYIFAITKSSTKSVYLYDLRNTQTPLKEITSVKSPIDELTFTRDGQRLLVGSYRLGAVSTVNVETGLSESMYFLQPTRTRFNLSVSLCSTYAIATTASNTVDIWNISTRVKVRSLVGHDGPPIGVFSPRDALIATASMPVALWVPFNS
jgi:WD40 repeat protein